MRIAQYSDQFYNKQKCDQGVRSADMIVLIVIHDTEGYSAESGATTLTTRTDASTQLCVDDDNTFRIVPELHIQCGVKSYNTTTIHIEQTGFSKWRKAEWIKHLKTIQRAAYWAAHWSLKYEIPPKFRTTVELNAGKVRGITTHNNLSLSKLSDSTHTDPGLNYPLVGHRSFMALLRFYRLGLKARIVPGPKEA